MQELCEKHQQAMWISKQDYLMRRAVFPDRLFVRLKKSLVGTQNENVADLRDSQPGYRNGHQGPGCNTSNAPAGITHDELIQSGVAATRSNIVT